jgi:pyridoxamine 5'-phosphate oxidase
LERQVIVNGFVEKTSDEESRTYFSNRPRGSQLGALASHQDAIIASRSVLEREYAHLQELFQGREIPAPSFWGGFRIIPFYFEFWQGRSDRLHDRFCYILENDSWVIRRLSP